MNPYIQLIPYACFGLAGLLVAGSISWSAWRADHPKKTKPLPRNRESGMLE